MIGMQMGQGQDVDGGEIEAIAQQGPEAAGAQIKNEQAAAGCNRQAG